MCLYLRVVLYFESYFVVFVLYYSVVYFTWKISIHFNRFKFVYRVILGNTLHGVKRGGGVVQVERPLLKLTERVTLECVSDFGKVVVLKGLLACLLYSLDRHAQVSTWFSFYFNIEFDINLIIFTFR